MRFIKKTIGILVYEISQQWFTPRCTINNGILSYLYVDVDAGIVTLLFLLFCNEELTVVFQSAISIIHECLDFLAQPCCCLEICLDFLKHLFMNKIKQLYPYLILKSFFYHRIIINQYFFLFLFQTIKWWNFSLRAWSAHSSCHFKYNFFSGLLH